MKVSLSGLFANVSSALPKREKQYYAFCLEELHDHIVGLVSREDERQSLWPDEPALSGVDDGVPDWVDRTKATGNAVLPQIPELIGRAIKETLSTNGAVK